MSIDMDRRGLLRAALAAAALTTGLARVSLEWVEPALDIDLLMKARAVMRENDEVLAQARIDLAVYGTAVVQRQGPILKAIHPRIVVDAFGRDRLELSGG